ncbi:MAG: hypothetical protein ACI37S_01905 [Candidatus Gastranaerophilaceae bacterium]
MEIKKYLTKDIIVIFITNLLTDVSCVMSIGYILCMLFSHSDLERFALPLFLILNLIFFLHFITLPILYFFMAKFSKNEIVQKFINKLRTSNKFKLQILGYSLFATLLNRIIYYSIFERYNNFLLSVFDIISFVVSAVVDGLLGSYLVLYLYWYIEDKAKSYISKQNTLLSKFVVLSKLLR